MSKTMTLNLRVGGVLGKFVAANVGDEGAYENVSEYVRYLIGRDMARADQESFELLRAELTHAFAAPDNSYQTLSADALIQRNRRREQV